MSFNLKELLKQGPVLLDGATGTNLLAAGMPSGVCSELWICEHQETLLDLQRRYRAAGSQIVYAPTFTGNPIKLAEYGAANRLVEINRLMVSLSQKAVLDDKDGNCYVAGDLTMTGRSLKPGGTMEFDTLVDCYKEQISAIAEAGVDLFVIETMMSLAEMRAAVIAVKETTDLPVFVTMTFEQNGRTLYGTDPVTALVTLQALGVDAFGLNCSCGPDKMVDWVSEMAKYARIPLIAKPNAGLPKLVDGNAVFDMDKEAFADAMLALIDAGASIVGGCCGTTPDYIAHLKEAVREKYAVPGRWSSMYEQIYREPEDAYRRVLTSERCFETFVLDGTFSVVGERINPTGKKKLQAALKNNQMELVCEIAESQVEMGAKILDINVGMPGIDEKAMMLEVVGQVTETVSAPLCIDSSSPEVVEAALRVYPGRALVNSVSCEKAKIEKLLPAVKKYGAMFILLPMTDDGIPSTLRERLANIAYVLEKAYELGFSKEDIVVDGLVGSVGAIKQAALDTLNTIDWCRKEGLMTICGLSNISFGLPDRIYVNSIFLALAISKGLTMAIANPSQELLMRSGSAADLLMAKEGADLKYIERTTTFAAGDEIQNSVKKTVPAKGATDTDADAGKEKEADAGLSDILRTIKNDVLKGKTKSVVSHVSGAMAEGVNPSDILNQALIPAINLVGEYFSQQKYFLPQLMMSANTMRKAVDFLEPELLKNQEGTQGSVVVIATVKGDVHDIGKNLVAMMMRNYGFKVIDLGIDVDKETIIHTAVEHKAKIIALSALMTTTMQYMKEVIVFAKENHVDAKIIIGGAATTEEFAEQIGADGYSEDAVGAVRLVKELLHLPIKL